MAALGKEGEPTRVLMFSGGAFGTAMQLGVAHALLVSRSEAPDLVVGVSAGAINAAAVAEILQAGDDLDGEARLDAQTARFRTIFATCQAAPGELLSALKPDSTQIDAKRPLEPLSLPIHLKQERDWRREAIDARSGIIRLFNTALGLKLPVGAMVRGLRCWLGVRDAREISWEVRPFVYLKEATHLLLLTASHLPALAPLARLMVWAAIFRFRPLRPGGSAGDLINRSPMLEQSLKLVLDALALVVLIPTWFLVALLVAVPAPVATVLWVVTMVTGKWLVKVADACRNGWRSPRSKSGKGTEEDTGPWSRIWSRIRTESQRLIRLVHATVEVKYFAAWFRLAVWLLALGALARGVIWLVRLFTGAVSEELFVGLVAVPLVLGLIGMSLVALRRKSLLTALLQDNRLATSLFHPHALRQLLVRLFDPEYFATVGGGGDMDEIVSRALDPAQPWPKASKSDRASPAGRKIRDYASKKPPIHVGIVAADLASGRSEILPLDVPIVDALLAATAVCPIFPAKGLKWPRKVEKGREASADGDSSAAEAAGDDDDESEVRWFIDAVNIANEPTRPALAYLRDVEFAPGVPAVHLYPVCSLPMSQPELPTNGEAAGDDRTLLSVVERALDLQRFRDATLERRLTELFSRVIPAEAGVTYDVGSGESAKRYLRAWVYPIEPEAPLSANTDLLRASGDQERRRIMAETVADGCRAAMEAMLQESIAKIGGDGSAPCRQVMAVRLRDADLRADLPASDPEGGPGVSEVCRHCALHRSEKGEELQALSKETGSTNLPQWPIAGKPSKLKDQRGGRADRPLDEHKTAVLEALQSSSREWPSSRDQGLKGDERATVSMLFGGGVFRGVYLLGVLNALNEARLKPDLVAGASVGSITAAMAARVFEQKDDNKRQHGIQQLAATYLALDRLILTDRFADFVRSVTVRGAQTRFSLSDADRTFRRYEAKRGHRFSEGARAVFAGIERLLWISPFELAALLRVLRQGDSQESERLLRLYFQEILDRSGVGAEILGSEPLQLLIREHVLRGGESKKSPRERALTARFDEFIGKEGDQGGIVFLATATNLDRGRLEILGDRQMGSEEGSVSLLQGLLASSAFPGVFRPRSRWEVFPRSRTDHRLADGGVMDNLPLDAVVHHLDLAAQAGRLERRPDAPHLVFTGSLQREVGELQPAELEKVRKSWRRVRRRARELGYNQKLDLYQVAQEALDEIYRQAENAGEAAFKPLHLKVVAVRPKWLCQTFAFHPMLGFRRREQAASIAHGCASTLHRLAEEEADHLRAWGAEVDRLPGTLKSVQKDASGKRKQRSPKQDWTWPSWNKSWKIRRKGNCWFRRDTPCPFSGESLKKSGLRENTRNQLTKIYKQCRRKKTHSSDR